MSLLPCPSGERPQSGGQVKRSDDGSFATVIAVELAHPKIGRELTSVK